MNVTHQPYQYVGDNPVSNTDPTGECECSSIVSAEMSFIRLSLPIGKSSIPDYVGLLTDTLYSLYDIDPLVSPFISLVAIDLLTVTLALAALTELPDACS